ncbi:hypothetical protein ACJIZ3_007902 [Penstemon smallii]|uniref:Uncharacterized protein n=1 Tax=Penstemon smallii TaxID=265156 RepID=A0ABD3T890_9LAMI
MAFHPGLYLGLEQNLLLKENVVLLQEHKGAAINHIPFPASQVQALSTCTQRNNLSKQKIKRPYIK